MGVRLARDPGTYGEGHRKRVARPSATPAPSAKTRQEKLTGRSRVYATSADYANARPDRNIPGLCWRGGATPWEPPPGAARGAPPPAPPPRPEPSPPSRVAAAPPPPPSRPASPGPAAAPARSSASP